MKVVKILRERAGITLAQTDTDHYLVGVCYTPGLLIETLRPTVDFLRTTSLPVAEHFFQLKTRDDNA